MNTAIKINELAEEYVEFQKLDKDELDLKEHIRLYESLNEKLEKIGMSFYDLSRYIKTTSLTT